MLESEIETPKEENNKLKHNMNETEILMKSLTGKLSKESRKIKQRKCQTNAAKRNLTNAKNHSRQNASLETRNIFAQDEVLDIETKT